MKPFSEWSDEELRVKVAELCGWERVSVADYNSRSMRSKPPFRFYTNPRGLPNYPRDLNAMQEAERMLTDDQKIDYIRLLNRNDFSYRRLAFATARQRCEAFVLAL